MGLNNINGRYSVFTHSLTACVLKAKEKCLTTDDLGG